jgi:NTE family protein
MDQLAATQPVAHGAPVSLKNTGSPFDAGRTAEPGIALCLSGGGYRAMLFHVGTLWRLNEWGLLPAISRISSVSGGSITAGLLGLKWPLLGFDPAGVAQNFATEIVGPIRALASESIDVESVLLAPFLPGSAADRVAKAYRKFLYGDATLQALPAAPAPLFVINATNVQSGALWRFSRSFMADYRVGAIRNPTVPLATAVAASSAFPPVLSPMTLKLDPQLYDPPSGLPSEDLHYGKYMTKVYLTDGGVYDNLGLETAWKRYKTVFVSDGGGKLQPDEKPDTDWLRHAYRVNEVIDNQVRSLRKRLLIESYELHRADPQNPSGRSGAYWGIRQDMQKYAKPPAPHKPPPGLLFCPFDKTILLANESTRLDDISDATQNRLINWGYAVCDASMRTWHNRALAEPRGFPYAGGVG